MPRGLGLRRIAQRQTPPAAVAEQVGEAGQILGVEMISVSRTPASMSVLSA